MSNTFSYNIFVVIVVYNKSIDNSTTIINLKKLSLTNLSILILDNSIEDYQNKEKCEANNIHYISMDGNKGLSKAYNAALHYIEQVAQGEDIIVWLDDDTEITHHYFESLIKSINCNEEADVFAPFIIGQDDRIYSPNSARFLKNKLPKSLKDTKFKKFNAINSCLSVKFKVYEKYRYNEKLFLDSVDQNFFDDLRKLDVKFEILKTKISQNFSQREENIEASVMIKRLEIRVKDLMVYSRKCILYTFLGVIKSIGWGITLGWKCKSIKMLGTCIKYSITGFLTNIRCFVNNKCFYT